MSFNGDSRCGSARFDRERGRLEVEVARFYIDRDEVSRDRYDRCVEQGGCAPVDELGCRLYEDDEWRSGRPIRIREEIGETPVTCVTLAEAESYCGWVGARLPTEAEWAVAAGVGVHAFPGAEFRRLWFVARCVSSGALPVRSRRRPGDD